MKQEIIEWLKAVIWAIVVVTVLQFFIQPTTVFNTSMYPTLVEKDVLILHVTKNVKQGDIITFKSNETFRESDLELIPFYKRVFVNTDTKKQLIKRVIGVPGDKVAIKDGLVYVNDELFEEAYYEGYTGPDREAVVVTEGKYYVMGDNRPVSLDSRSDRVGLVDKESIAGKTLLRIWPLNKIGKVD